MQCLLENFELMAMTQKFIIIFKKLHVYECYRDDVLKP
jgi:hypothetical protein